MNIGWATPFNHRSAIGRFSRFVCDELRKQGHKVTVIRIEYGEALEMEALASDLPVVTAELADVAGFDKLIVNVGNHAPYHAELISLFTQRAPIGIFHDAEMRDFEWGLQHRYGFAIPRLEGSEATDREGSSQDLVALEARPLLGALAAMCSGAVVHGPHYAETVARYCSGPVVTIPLCYPDVSSGDHQDRRTWQHRVAIFGVINSYKQPGRVLRALAKLKHQLGHIELILLGDIEPRFQQELVDQAKTLELQPPAFHGYVSDETLQLLLEGSGAVCCLRYPVTEGGSASLATALYLQRPLIVADVASYSLVPDDSVYKVSYGEDADDLAAALLEIFKAPKVAEERSQRASLWAKKTYSAQSYVESLLPLFSASEPAETLMGLARDLVPAVTSPEGALMKASVETYSEVLTWMMESQGQPDEPWSSALLGHDNRERSRQRRLPDDGDSG